MCEQDRSVRVFLLSDSYSSLTVCAFAEGEAEEDEAEQGIVSTMLSQELQVLSDATAAESRRLKAARFFPAHPFYSSQHHQEHKECVLNTLPSSCPLSVKLISAWHHRADRWKRLRTPGLDQTKPFSACRWLPAVRDRSQASWPGWREPTPTSIFPSRLPTSPRLIRYLIAHVRHSLRSPKAQGPTQCVQDDAAGELFEDMANRARDGDWGAMRAEEEKWRLAGCYYFALRCLIYLLYAVPSLTLVRHLTLSWPMVRAMPSYFRYWCPYACAGGCGPEFVP